MNRKLVTQSELKAIINKAIKDSNLSIKDCREYEVSGIKQLAEPDEEGCNWSEDFFYSGPEPCSEAVRRIMAQHRTQYNLKD